MLNQRQLNVLEILKNTLDHAKESGLFDSMTSTGIDQGTIGTFCNDVNVFLFNESEKQAESTLSPEILPALSWDDFDSAETLAIGNKSFDVGEPAAVPKACAIDNPGCDACQ